MPPQPETPAPVYFARNVAFLFLSLIFSLGVVSCGRVVLVSQSVRTDVPDV